MDCNQSPIPTEALLPGAAFWLEYFITATEMKIEWTGWLSTEVTHISGKATVDSAISALSHRLELPTEGGRALGDTVAKVLSSGMNTAVTCVWW